MGAPDPHHESAVEVAADLAAIEARLRDAQAALDQAAQERHDALARLEEIHAERLAQQLDADDAADHS